MRRALRDHLLELREPPGDWLVLATELATNSIEASPADRPIELRLIAGEDRIELQVSDEGPGYEPQPAGTAWPDSSDRRGRGLMIVKAMADRFDVERTEGRTTTVVERQRVRQVDVAVLGLGSAGEAASTKLARAGYTVVGFEPSRVGGECPFVACMPSKSLLYDAHRARGDENPSAGWDAAVERRKEIVDNLDDTEHADGLTDAGVDLIRAPATLAGPHRIVADGREWKADHVLLATGSEPVVPDIDGLERDRIWTAFDALTTAQRPERLLIIGAGAVGCELSDVFASFGSDVSLIEHSDRLLPDHDSEVADRYLQALRSLGVDVHLDTGVDSVRHADQQHSVELSDGSTLEVDQIIVAAGQAPRLSGLGLNSIGLDPDEIPEIGPHRNVVGHDGLWVLGDLHKKHPWTHGANRDAAIVAAAITGRPWSTTKSAMPHATFTDPPAAHVGMAATEDNGYLRGVGRYSDIARSSTDQLEDGLVVVSVDPTSGVIEGCSAVGSLADEVIATATSLVQFGVTVADARTQVFAFPTISQVLEVAIADAFDQWEQRSEG